MRKVLVMPKRPTRLDYCQYLLVSPINHTLTNFAGSVALSFFRQQIALISLTFSP